MTNAAAADLARALGDAIGSDVVSTGPSDRNLHAEDLSFHPGAQPDVVAWARCTGDVAAVLRVASERHVPVVPFGAGSSLDGHVIPVHGGIALDLTRMVGLESNSSINKMSVREIGEESFSY